MENHNCKELETLSEDAFEPVEVTASEHEKFEGLVSTNDQINNTLKFQEINIPNLHLFSNSFATS